MADADKVIMTMAEFLAGAQESDLFQQVEREILQEQTKAVVLALRHERDRDWSLLNGQVVGGENFEWLF